MRNQELDHKEFHTGIDVMMKGKAVQVSLATQGGELPRVFNRGSFHITSIASISTPSTATASTTTRVVVPVTSSRLQEFIYADSLHSSNDSWAFPSSILAWMD
jgi:hypothetical protein